MMSLTRRSLLHSLAALPLAHTLDALALSRHRPHPRGAGDLPSPSSIFVLLTGPWLIFQSADKILSALTIGSTSQLHRCPVEHWRNDKFVATLLPDLPPDGPAQIEPSGAAQAADFTSAFSAPFANDPFAWVSKTGSIGNPAVKGQHGDRAVTLPLPTNIYAAGFLLHATVSNAGVAVLQQNNVQPHVVTILEYAPAPGQTVALSLTVNGKTRSFVPGDHVIFRLQHWGPCHDEVKHVQETFDFLASHFTSAKPPVTLAFSQPTTDFRVGNHTDGISQTELGLGMGAVCPNDTTYANCAGGTIITGP